MPNKIICGDVLEVLKTLDSESVQCVVTSPPYWGLRKYIEDDAPEKKHELGLEKTPEEYVAKMVEVFREVRRVLREDGTLWLNLGDSYSGSNSTKDSVVNKNSLSARAGHTLGGVNKARGIVDGLKAKDLCGIPWRVAFALQADGWWLRQDIIWNKPNPMPESVTDRCTKSHEYIFLLTKAGKYFYDAEAVKEPISETYANDKRPHRVLRQRFYPDSKYVKNGMIEANASDFPKEHRDETRNKRSVWTITTQPYAEAHFATFPEEIPLICIKAGTSEKGCCQKCGSTWERIIEKGNLIGKDRGGNYNGREIDSMVSKNYGTPGMAYENITTGWQPACTCDPGYPVPCTVLDPFSGAGTTCMVAKKLNRQYIGVELNPKYVEMSEKRIETEVGTLF